MANKKKLNTIRYISQFLLLFFILPMVMMTYQNCSGGFEATTEGMSELLSMAPGVTINSSPQTLTNSRTATITFGATPDSSTITQYECQTNPQGSYSPCTSPVILTNLADGGQEFSVRAVDKNGKVSKPVKGRWTVDATAPQVAITIRPTAVTGSTTAQFAFTTSDNISTLVLAECSLDGVAFTACTSPRSYTNLAAGTHSFRVRARDEANNVSAIATANWTVDLTAPALTLTSLFTSPTRTSTVQFSFSATDGGVALTSGFQCRIDNNAFANCTSPYTSPALTTGNHTFGIRVADTAGNLSQEQTAAFVVDLVAPTVQFAQPNSHYNTRDVTINFVAADNLGAALALSCRVDSGAYSACTSNTSFALPSNISEGSHTVSVQAVDQAGNTVTRTSNAFIIDLTPPVIANFSGPTNCTGTCASANVSWTATDATSSPVTTTCSINNGAAVNCSSPHTISAGLTASGTQTFVVRATDASGLSVTRTHTWTITPATSCNSTLRLAWNRTTENEDGSAATTLAGYRISYGRSPGSYTNTLNVPGAAVESATLTNLPSGNYYLAIQAYTSDNLQSEYSPEITANVPVCTAVHMDLSTGKRMIASLAPPMPEISIFALLRQNAMAHLANLFFL